VIDVSGTPSVFDRRNRIGLRLVNLSATSAVRIRRQEAGPIAANWAMAKRGASTRKSRAKPRRMRIPPRIPRIPMPGPTPVKAKDEDFAVTAPPPPPPPLPLPPPGLVAGALVVGVTGTVVVEDPPPATAITGAMEGTVGAEVVIPEGVTLLSG